MNPTAPVFGFRRHVSAYFKRLGFLLVLYTVIRVGFLLYSRDQFRGTTLREFAQAFQWGMRFDLAAIMALSLPFSLLSLFPGRWLETKFGQKFLKILFWISHAPLLLVGVIDFEFYRITDRRTTSEIFKLSTEIGDHAGHLWLDYWWISVFVIATGAALWFCYPVLKAPSSSSVRRKRDYLYLPAGILLSIALVRGTLDRRPLAPGHAFLFRTPALGNLALNTPFVFITSVQARMEGQETKRIRFFTADLEASQLIQRPQPHPLASPPRPDNVFFIIVESLGSEHVGFENFGDPRAQLSRTPFMDSLAKNGGVAFTRHYANSKRSITALPALLLSIPDWLPGAFSTSIYQSNVVHGLGHGLRKHGYSTWFFHGARSGTMTFDYLSRQAGFENYYSISNYGAYPPEDHDNTWGIYDEPMLQRIAGVFSGLREPFGGVVFTLSTHQPHRLPARYKDRFRGGGVGLGPSIEYFDNALRLFFETAEKQPWFKNTLFVITGDHTFKVMDPKYNHPLGTYDVPLLFYHPSRQLPRTDTDRIAQQIDIAPSILDLLGIRDQTLLPYGASLFSPSEGRALVRLSNQEALVTQGFITSLSDGFNPQTREIDVNGVISPKVDSENTRLGLLLKAYLQHFHNGLLDNSWFHGQEGR